MALGLGQLRLDPKAFWAMTPKELEAAIRGRLGQAWDGGPPLKSDLAALMRRFPDS